MASVDIICTDDDGKICSFQRWTVSDPDDFPTDVEEAYDFFNDTILEYVHGSSVGFDMPSSHAIDLALLDPSKPFIQSMFESGFDVGLYTPEMLKKYAAEMRKNGNFWLRTAKKLEAYLKTIE